MMLKRIKIFIKEIDDKRGGYFTVYKALSKTGRWVDVVFCKDVEKPTSNCTMVIDVRNASYQDAKYPKLYVRKVEKFDYKLNKEDIEREYREILSLYE